MLNEDTIREISAGLNEPEWMLDRRIESFSLFKKMQMPNFRYGIGISVDVSKLDFNELKFDANDSLFINAPNEVEIFKFEDAYKKYENLLRENFMTKCVLAKEDKFSSLHGSFFNDGILIRIPENVEAESPIEINLDVISKSRIDHILILAEKNSKVKIIDSSISDENSSGFRNQIVEIIVKENAKVEYISVQNFGNEEYNFSRKRAHVEKDGSLQWIDCCIGGKFTQSLIKTYLNGENSESKSLSVVYGDANQCFDINSETVHAASRSKSDMLTRVVLNENAKAIYRGLIKVNPKAVKCEGYQKDDTILLSDQAEADAVPNLQIENNDVKCSHGATISQIDDTKLFYMMSRGIDEKNSKKIIVEGFFDPILMKINDDSLKESIQKNISRRLGAI